MKHQKIFSLASVAAMLASWVTVPVNAASVNQYEISCETLASAVTVGDTVVAPGTVAVTMSIDGNTGFQSNTLALQLDENYEVLKTADGNPVLQTGEVLEDFHAFAAENDNKICVAMASSFTTSCDGDLFTIYATEKESAEICSSNVAVITAPEDRISPFSVNTVFVPHVGDIDGDGIIDAVDATELYGVVSKNGGTISYAALNNESYFRKVFPSKTYPGVTERKVANCWNVEGWRDIQRETGVDPRVIDNKDGDEILQYSAYAGAGKFYDGLVGNEVGDD